MAWMRGMCGDLQRVLMRPSGVAGHETNVRRTASLLRRTASLLVCARVREYRVNSDATPPDRGETGSGSGESHPSEPGKPAPGAWGGGSGRREAGKTGGCPPWINRLQSREGHLPSAPFRRPASAVVGASPLHSTTAHTLMGSLKKRRKTKINKHKRKKRMRANRHKKRLRYKS